MFPTPSRPWLRATRRQLLAAAVTVPVFAAVYLTAFWLRFDGQLGSIELHILLSTIGWVVIAKSIVFGCLHAHLGWNYHLTFYDLVVLVRASAISSVLLSLVDYLLIPALNVPRSVFLMDLALTVLILGGLAAIARFLHERDLPSLLSRSKTPVFIVGANNTGESLLRSIRRSRDLSYRVVGFIAENESPLTHIGGVPVVGRLGQTCELAERYGVKEVFITAGDLSGKQVRELVDTGSEHGVAVKVIPSYEQVLKGNVALRPRTVSIEDLLRRDPVCLNLGELHRWLDRRVLLVTGSAGSIGSEICRQLLQFAPEKVIVVDRAENGQFFLERELQKIAPNCDIEVCVADINDVRRMRAIFDAHRPDIVFHAAAYKHVPLMEANPGEAICNIALATRGLANLADEFGVASFVMISTDKAVRPSSVMGACKRAAELYVQALSAASDCRFVTVRFGNVLDSAGSVLPIFRRQIAEGGPITVTHRDMKRYFMTIPEASQLVIQAGAMGMGGEIFVLDMGEPVRIVELAKDMIRLSGLSAEEDIEIRFIGMRPGEKLVEELHASGEEHLKTSHPKIMVAKSNSYELTQIVQRFDRLARITAAPLPIILNELQQVVPDFRRQDERVWRRAA